MQKTVCIDRRRLGRWEETFRRPDAYILLLYVQALFFLKCSDAVCFQSFRWFFQRYNTSLAIPFEISMLYPPLLHSSITSMSNSPKFLRADHLPIQLIERNFRGLAKFKHILEINLYSVVKVCLLADYTSPLIIIAGQSYLCKNLCLKKTFTAICRRTQLPLWNLQVASRNSPQRKFFNLRMSLLLS